MQLIQRCQNLLCVGLKLCNGYLIQRIGMRLSKFASRITMVAIFNIVIKVFTRVVRELIRDRKLC